MSSRRSGRSIAAGVVAAVWLMVLTGCGVAESTGSAPVPAVVPERPAMTTVIQPTETAATPPPEAPGQNEPADPPPGLGVDYPPGNPKATPGPNGAPPQPGGASAPATGAGGLPDVAAQPPWTVGESRPFEVDTHCGIRTAKIGSELWVVTGPISQQIARFVEAQPQSRLPDRTAPNAPASGEQILSGTMTLVEPFLARFTWGDLTSAGGAGSADFAPPSGPVPLCA